ncbi:MAG: hypothetical protein ACKO96_05240, partial [Flammeovirgaceae bacterium]
MAGPDTDKDMAAKIEAAIATGERIAGEILSYRKSGESFWNGFSLNPYYEDSGSLHIIYVIRNLSLQREAEVKASKFERDYRFIFENVDSAITVHGVDTHIR